MKNSSGKNLGERRSRDVAIATNFVARNDDKLAWNAFIVTALARLMGDQYCFARCRLSSSRLSSSVTRVGGGRRWAGRVACPAANIARQYSTVKSR